MDAGSHLSTCVEDESDICEKLTGRKQSRHVLKYYNITYSSRETGMFSPTLRAVASILSSAVRSTSGLYLSSSVCIPSRVSPCSRQITDHNQYLVLPLRTHKSHNVFHVVAKCLALAGLAVSFEQSSQVGRDVLVSLHSWRDALEKKRCKSDHTIQLASTDRVHRSRNFSGHAAVQSSSVYGRHVKANRT